jgi:deazaflavin-dependent oxidoreductase (nitroreductase family)
MSNSDSFTNETVITEFRSNGGKVSGYFANISLLLLTTIGAKSGQARTIPLAYTTDEDRIVIMASKGGAPTHPDWYYNLLAHPVATVEIGSERFQARAEVTEEPDRERLFVNIVKRMPEFGEYQRKTSRKIPVLTLERIG